MIKSGKVDGAAADILTWNTSSTNYDGYTLWFEAIETVETPITLEPLTLNFANGESEKVTIGWTAGGYNVDCSGTSASYSYTYSEKTINGVVQNPDAQYFDNTLSLTVEPHWKANWTLTKEGSTIASGQAPSTGGAVNIYSWNTKTKDLKGATLTITTEFDPGDYYFILKANPAHFTSIKSGYSYSGPFTTDLNYSLEGEYNILTEAEYSSYVESGNYTFQITCADGVEYSVTKLNADETSSTPVNNATVSKNVQVMKANMKGTIEITSSLLLTEGSPWTYTVIANPVHVELRDAKASNATINCSTSGETYSTSQQFTQPQLTTKVANVAWSAYFFPAGADTSDKSQAIAKLTDQVTATTGSWKGALYPTTLSNTNFSGGTLLIESEEGVGTGTVTINIDGTATNVVVTNGSTNVSQNSTSYTVDLESRYLTFAHSTNTKHFFKLLRNGAEVEPSAQAAASGSSDGAGASSETTYSYNIKDAKGGDVYDITVNYPAGPWAVNIVVPDGCADFVQSVTVDGVETSWSNGTPLSITGGQEVRVVGDTYNYIVNESRIGGVATSIPSASVSKIISEDTTIEFVLTKPERAKSFTFICGEYASGVVRTHLNSVLSYDDSGTYEISFSDDDNPINFSALCTSTDSNVEYDCYWYINGVVQPSHSLALTTSVNDGDVIKVDFLKTGVTTYTVNFVLEGIETYPTFNDGDIVVSQPSNQFIAGTELTLTDNEYVHITGLSVVDSSSNPVSTTGFSFTVNGDYTATISGKPKEPAKIVTVNVTGNATALWALDYDEMNVIKSDFEVGENTMDLSKISTLMLVLDNTMTKYYISSMTKNGGDASAYFDEGWGSYVFTPAAGDVYDITISEKVFDLTLNVYITGFDNKNNCVIAEKTGNGPRVVGTLQEGANIVKYCAADLPLFISATANAGYTAKVFLNNEELVYDLGYSANCSDGDNLYIVFEPKGKTTEQVDLGSRGLRTFVSHYDCVFDPESTELKAYVCTAFNPGAPEVTLERVTGTVAAGTGLLIMGYITDAEGNYTDTLKEIEIAAAGGAAASPRREGALGTNLLEGVYQYATIPNSNDDAESDYFVLPENSDTFQKSTSESQSTMNQAILKAPNSVVSSVAVVNDIYTALESITWKIEEKADGIFTLTGVKLPVNDPTLLPPGLYLIHGKKTLIK